MGEIHHGRHCAYTLTFHAVLVVKYRKKCVNKEVGDYIINHVRVLLRKADGTLIEANYEEDHVHLLFEIPPDTNLSNLMGSMKTATSRMVRKVYHEELKPYLWGDSFWSDSYFLSTTGGASIDVVRKYLEAQGKPKRRYTRRGVSSMPLSLQGDSSPTQLR